MSNLSTKIKPETWVAATWEEYLQLSENPDYDKAKFYYHQGKIRIEMTPVGYEHGSDHSIIHYAINLYAALNQIPLIGLDNLTYRQPQMLGFHPDLSYYVGAATEVISNATGIIDLNHYPPPNLVVEIAKSSLADDQGEKRLLYESLDIAEYWIVDVQNTRILAFQIENNGSRRIAVSQVLPNLDLSILESALRQTCESDHGQVGAWLLSQWQ
ncbi:Uma2 family endonuclease [Spirulina sp. CS-785/01]|uniref:Uma2 family endonuclease n=1 Tax=Spirulina sp. CS-785/01 TaxID=3021716 RepID=UPI00232F9790|nr:Uma2 family endonuclease [Spirulina sp. CS-785/01]MDB9315199.1 Uma2 family endonuclease [Spirulina sp. CS-785/01]